MHIGEKIRSHLRSRKLLVPDLVAKTGLKRGDVRNLLYNRSRSPEKLQLIANALNIPLSDLLPAVIQSPFQYKTYALAVSVVYKNFESFNIVADKEQFDEYVAKIYNYIIDNQDKVEKDFLMYCEGLLVSAIAIGTIQKKSSKPPKKRTYKTKT